MYVANWSGGKDSTATIILAHEHGEPLDLIIFSEVMFDENTSGELPEHMEFVHRCMERFKEWGYPTQILHSKDTYMFWFMRVIKHSKTPERNGKIYGFPLAGKCTINSKCKVGPIREFNKHNKNAVHYVGIASDEPKRLERLKPNYISLLDKYNITEQGAYNLCKQYGMLSPIYKFSKRGGCWFCPNMLDSQLKHIRNNHPDLWKKLLELEQIPNKTGYCWNTLHKQSVIDKEKQFDLEDRQITWDQYLERLDGEC